MRRLSVFLLLLSCAFAPMSGCAGLFPQMEVQKAYYTTVLTSVDRPTRTEEKYGSKQSIELTDGRFAYSDQLIDAVLLASRAQVEFAISNKSEHSIKIEWNSAAFIDTDGKSSSVINQGVRFYDMNSPRSPTVVPSSGHVTDVVVPTSRVSFSESRGWEVKPLVFPHVYTRKAGTTDLNFPAVAEAQVGKLFGVLLPLEIEGVVNEYTFWFEITAATVGPNVTKAIHLLEGDDL